MSEQTSVASTETPPQQSDRGLRIFGVVSLMAGIAMPLLAFWGLKSSLFARSLFEQDISSSDSEVQQKAQFMLDRIPSSIVLYIGFICAVVVSVLLLIAAVGYLMRSRAIGYRFGNMFGVIAILVNIPGLATRSIGVLGALVVLFAGVTLILLWTRFDKSFRQVES